MMAMRTRGSSVRAWSAGEISSTSSDSGVIIRMSGGSAMICLRVAADTSPCHLPTRSPHASAIRVSRASWLFNSARSGQM